MLLSFTGNQDINMIVYRGFIEAVISVLKMHFPVLKEFNTFEM